MPYCSIDEAFPDTATQSGVSARKEERKKAKRCGGPALKFLKGQDSSEDLLEDVDPDRPANRPLPPAEKLIGSDISEGFAGDQDPSNTKWIPKREMDNEDDDLSNQHVKDVIGQKSRNTLPRAVEKSSELPDPKKTMFGKKVPSYFGKSMDDVEKFADFNPSLSDKRGYEVMPADFIGSFGLKGVDKASGKGGLPIPSVKDAWKPLTPVGGDTSFFDSLPSPGGYQMPELSSFFSKEDKESILKKLDTLFARLEDLESNRNEYAHTEISLFILSGLFLMFGLESVRKMKF